MFIVHCTNIEAKMLKFYARSEHGHGILVHALGEEADLKISFPAGVYSPY